MELDAEQLKSAMECSPKVDALINNDSCTTFLSEYCSIHVQRKRDLFCKQCVVDICRDCVFTVHKGHEYTTSADLIEDEIWRLEEAGDGVVDLLEEVKRVVSGVREMKIRVRSKKDNYVNVTREAFSCLRKAIDEREEQTIADIKEEANKKEKSLEVCLVLVPIATTVI